MLIKGQPMRDWLYEHQDGIVVVWCIVCGVAALILTIGERG